MRVVGFFDRGVVESLGDFGGVEESRILAMDLAPVALAGRSRVSVLDTRCFPCLRSLAHFVDEPNERDVVFVIPRPLDVRRFCDSTRVQDVRPMRLTRVRVTPSTGAAISHVFFPLPCSSTIFLNTSSLSSVHTFFTLFFLSFRTFSFLFLGARTGSHTVGSLEYTVFQRFLHAFEVAPTSSAAMSHASRPSPFVTTARTRAASSSGIQR